jgi:hypothetical protein
MKTSKKFIAGISAFLLAITSSVATVSAVTTDDADGFQIVVSGDQTGLKAGDTFDVTVDLKNVPDTGIAGCEFAVEYDSTQFELQSVVENTSLTGDAANAELEIVPDLGTTMINGDTYSCLDYNIMEDKVAFLWATGLGEDYFIKNDGTLVTLTFAVRDDAEDSDSSISIDAIRDGGEVLFATTDTSGNYVETAVDYSASASVGVGETVTPEVTTTTEETPEVTTTEEVPEVTTTTEETPEVTTTASGETKLGDVNEDGNIRVNDVQMARQYTLHAIELEGQAFINADVTQDGNLRVNDIQRIRQYVLHIITSLEE